jgi:ABC-type transport system involved in multi-copper enzyme maturation permease subunit
MTFAPVIIREMRAEARRPLNFWFRDLGAATATLMLALFILNQAGRNNQIGGELFVFIHSVMLLLSLLVVPLMTADCIAREKREGTLPLLFLTPLTATGIVIGKSLVHLLRALTLVVSAWPVLAIPLLLGGVSARDVLYAFTFQLCAILIGFSAGLIASAFCKSWVRTLVLSEVLAGALIFLFTETTVVLCVVVNVMTSLRSSRFLFWSDIRELFRMNENLSDVFFLATGLDSTWSRILKTVQSVPFQLLAVCGLICVLAILLAAWRVKKSWQDNPPSPLQLWFTITFCTPRFWTDVLRANLRQRLNRNPIAWLQQHTWGARLTKWGWFAFCMIVLTRLVTTDSRWLMEYFRWVGLALLLGLAFSSVGSFQREKQNGVLELLLVSPLSERQIVQGRLLGIWQQFAPAAILLVAVRIYFWNTDGYHRAGDMAGVFWITFFLGSCVVVPLFGLYFAGRCQNIFAAWLWTCLLAVAVPGLISHWIFTITNPVIPASYWDSEQNWLTETLIYLALGATAAAIALFLLFRLLKSRQFTARPA